MRNGRIKFFVVIGAVVVTVYGMATLLAKPVEGRNVYGSAVDEAYALEQNNGVKALDNSMFRSDYVYADGVQEDKPFESIGGSDEAEEYDTMAAGNSADETVIMEEAVEATGGYDLDSMLEAYGIEEDEYWVEEGHVAFVSPMTGEVRDINMNAVLEAYESAPTIAWDCKDASKEIYALWEFLVKQSGVHVNIASAIIGNCACEGKFGQRQWNTGEYISSLEDAEYYLSDNYKNVGFGIVQWTDVERRGLLLEYYREAVKHASNVTAIRILAEINCLYDELQSYGLFDYDQAIAIEDACGRIGVKYEAYRGCRSDWKMVGNGVYELDSESGSGALRLEYAYNVYRMMK